MNERKLLDEARELFKTVDENTITADVKNALSPVIDCLKEVLSAAFDEASETEAGRRWFNNLVEKRAIPALALKEANIKTLLQEFDFSLSREEIIEKTQIYLIEIEKIIESGKGRYISG